MGLSSVPNRHRLHPNGATLRNPGSNHRYGSGDPEGIVSDDDWFESGGGGDQSSDESPFDGESGEPDEEFPFEDEPTSGDDPSMADFEAAFDAGSSDNDEFEEEFDSDIPRLDLGITGLDEMIQGGVPERSLMVVIGSAGTGKTTFGLQFIHQGLKQDENVVYITLEESEQAIKQAATEKGWAFDRYAQNDRLAVVDLDPIEMANSLRSIRSDLPRLIERFEADRLVLDSVSLLEMMYDSPARRRTEVFDFTKSLKEAGVTTMLTSEASDTDPYTSKHGIIEYLTDGVFVLQYVRSEFQETRLAVEIQKIRNANHSRETKPYEITGEGISVYRQASIF